MRGRWDRIYGRFVNWHLGRHVSRTPPQCKNPSSYSKEICWSEGFGELGAGQSSKMKLLSALHNVWPMTSSCVSPSRARPANISVLPSDRGKSRAEMALKELRCASTLLVQTCFAGDLVAILCLDAYRCLPTPGKFFAVEHHGEHPQVLKENCID